MNNQGTQMECQEMTRSQQVMAVAKYLWGKNHHTDTPGVCRYCGKKLKNDYYVYAMQGDQLRCFATEAGTEASKKAEGIRKRNGTGINSIPMAWENVACDLMNNEDIYYAAKRQVQDWGRIKVESFTSRKVAVDVVGVDF